MNAHDRGSIAAMSRLVTRAAHDGDVSAIRIFDEAARELAAIVEAVRARSNSRPTNAFPVSYSGGVFNAGALILGPLRRHLEGQSGELSSQAPMVTPSVRSSDLRRQTRGAAAFGRGHGASRRLPAPGGARVTWRPMSAATEIGMLSVENLTSRYGRIEVLHGVSLEVAEGEIVTLVGSNGAGKTTLLRAISGIQPAAGGTIRFAGQPIDRLQPHQRVARGIVQVPEGRQVFAPLTVDDNLRLGAVTRRDRKINTSLDRIYSTFPALAEKRHAAAGALSGGQQQMLALGRALMVSPS